MLFRVPRIVALLAALTSEISYNLNIYYTFSERQHDVRQVAPTEGLPPHRGRLPRPLQEGGGPQLGEAGRWDGQQHREPHGEFEFERLKSWMLECVRQKLDSGQFF